MRSFNVLKVLEANKENRNFQVAPFRQGRIQSIVVIKEEQQKLQHNNMIRVKKWNKSLNQRQQTKDPIKEVSYDFHKTKQEGFINQRYQRNKSLTNFNITQLAFRQDMQSIQPYQQDILDNILISYRKNQLLYNAFSFQTHVTEKMRCILLNWIIEVHYKFKLQYDSLYLAFYLIDKYLETAQINRSQFQLLGISSLFLGAKYEETYRVPKSKDLAVLCENMYNKQDVLEMESHILEVTSFELCIVYTSRIIEHFIALDDLARTDFSQNWPTSSMALHKETNQQQLVQYF